MTDSMMFVVISIDPVRLSEFTSAWPEQLGSLSVLSGVHGDRLSEFAGLSSKALGCRQSHIRVLEDFLATEHTHAVVFEDDAVLDATFSEALGNELPKRWDVLQFDSYLPTGKFNIPDRTPRTHAYAVTRFGARVLHREAVTRVDDIARVWRLTYPRLTTMCSETKIRQRGDE